MLGGCIGSRNYKHFFFFLTSCSLYCLLVLTLSTFSLIQTIIHEDEKDPHGISGEDKIMDAVTDSPAAVIAIILTFALGWGLMSLLSYHCWLLSIGQTTNEQLTNVYSEENAERNPYDHGCCGNTQLMMCKEMDESLLPDMSEMMTATEYIDTHYPVTVT
jgi:palmitoyltransferase ZDHHC9/14/18